MRVAIYARVSTEDKGQDTENQITQLKDYIAAMKWELIDQFVDHVSAGGVVKPQYDRMLVAAYQKKFDLLLFWSLDRLTREGVLATLKYLEKLAAYGIEWKSFTEQYLDSTGIFKDAVISILATIARQEKIRIGERTKAGMARAKAKGIQLGRKAVTQTGRKKKGKNLPIANLSEIQRLRGEGKSLREVASLTGISKSAIDRLLSQKGENSLAA